MVVLACRQHTVLCFAVRKLRLTHAAYLLKAEVYLVVPYGHMLDTSLLAVFRQWTNQLEPSMTGVVVIAEPTSLRACKLRLERPDGGSERGWHGELAALHART